MKPTRFREDCSLCVSHAAAVCRMDAATVDAVLCTRCNHCEAVWTLLVVAGMAATGAAFGLWRAPRQAMIGAVKMPFMMLATVWLSAGAATMLNWLLGFGLSFSQVRRCILAAMAAASLLLGSLAPVVLLLSQTLPGPMEGTAVASYRLLLGSLVALVGVAGLLGVARLHRLMLHLAPSRAVALRTLAAWTLVVGLVGTQTSWLLSPFVQRPQQALTFWNPLAFRSNFFEYLWETVARSRHVD